jgi:hypothetical protein
MNYLDDDGYPTRDAIHKIQSWPNTDFNGLMEFIKPLWAYSNSGYWTETDTEDEIEYSISTAGWSGNEDLIDALGENRNMFWILCWVQSRRGGHYIFEVKKWTK